MARPRPALPKERRLWLYPEHQNLCAQDRESRAVSARSWQPEVSGPRRARRHQE